MRSGTRGVGEAIRAARLRRGWSQDHLAERLGTTQSNVSRWESGAATPGLDRLPALCAALEVPCEYFMRPAARDAGGE